MPSPNPFYGLITTDMQELHCHAIKHLVETCSVECSYLYGETITECPNCYYDSIGKKSTNKYKPSGPKPFNGGICPHCNGIGIKKLEQYDNINLVVIYDQNKWCNKIKVQTPSNYVATLSLPDTYTTLKKAKEIYVNSDIDQYVRLRYKRFSEPLPCGLGMTCVWETIWERIEN